MNKLEKEIEEYIQNVIKEKERKSYLAGICVGMEFILEKNLIGQFADWIGERFVKRTAGTWLLKGAELPFGDFDHSIDYTTEQIEDYWLNNVYGK